jgi:hypothetical protein
MFTPGLPRWPIIWDPAGSRIGAGTLAGRRV